MRGCAAQSFSSAPKFPFGECARLLAIGGDEDVLQRLPLDRFLDDGHRAKSAVNALDTVTGDEDEWNAAGNEDVGHGINEFSAEIDVDDPGVDFIVHGRNHGLG